MLNESMHSIQLNELELDTDPAHLRSLLVRVAHPATETVSAIGLSTSQADFRLRSEVREDRFRVMMATAGAPGRQPWASHGDAAGERRRSGSTSSVLNLKNPHAVESADAFNPTTRAATR